MAPEFLGNAWRESSYCKADRNAIGTLLPHSKISIQPLWWIGEATRRYVRGIGTSKVGNASRIYKYKIPRGGAVVDADTSKTTGSSLCQTDGSISVVRAFKGTKARGYSSGVLVIWYRLVASTILETRRQPTSWIYSQAYIRHNRL